MVASEEELISAKIPLEERDYCAHKKIEYLKCIADVFPWNYKCAHERHAQATCLYEEYDICVDFHKIIFVKNLHFSINFSVMFYE